MNLLVRAIFDSPIGRDSHLVLNPGMIIPQVPGVPRQDEENDDDLWEWERTYEHEKEYCRAQPRHMRAACWAKTNERNAACRYGKTIPPLIF